MNPKTVRIFVIVGAVLTAAYYAREIYLSFKKPAP